MNILNILDYQKTQERKLSLRDMAVVSKSKNAVLFMEKYKNLDIKQLKEDFQRFPTLSIFDKILGNNHNVIRIMDVRKRIVVVGLVTVLQVEHLYVITLRY